VELLVHVAGVRRGCAVTRRPPGSLSARLGLARSPADAPANVRKANAYNLTQIDDRIIGCELCEAERPPSVSHDEWSRIVVRRAVIRVWCKRHNINHLSADDRDERKARQ
jgi:hypothetical protein